MSPLPLSRGNRKDYFHDQSTDAEPARPEAARRQRKAQGRPAVPVAGPGQQAGRRRQEARTEVVISIRAQHELGPCLAKRSKALSMAREMRVCSERPSWLHLY